MQFPWYAVIKKSPKSRKPFLVVRDRERFDQWLASEFKEGDKVHLVVKKPSKERTHRQFRYLYSCVYPYISEEIGCSVEEADGIMKKRHLTVNIDSPLEYVKNKTDLDRMGLAKYIDAVRVDAAAMGIETQDPEEFNE